MSDRYAQPPRPSKPVWIHSFSRWPGNVDQKKGELQASRLLRHSLSQRIFGEFLPTLDVSQSVGKSF